MPPELLADVAVRASIPGADPVFTYRIPPRLRAGARTGLLVWAPLRRQRVQGIILDLYLWETARGGESHGLALHETPAAFRPDPQAPTDADAPIIRDLFAISDPEAALTPAQIRLARWLSDYYYTPLYDALALMLPPGVSQEAEPTWAVTPAGRLSDLGALPERERAVLYFLRQRTQQTERELRQALRGSDADLRGLYSALHERGLIERGTAYSRPRARPRIEQLVRLRASPAQIETAMAELGRAPKQRAVLEWLRNHQAERAAAAASGDLPADASTPPVVVTGLYRATGANRAALKALEQRELIELASREVRRDPLAGDDVLPDVPPPLTTGQERVWRAIAAALDVQTGDKRQETGEQASTKPDAVLMSHVSLARVFLLHGVTGSGKTEVYLRAIGRVLRQGRQALVLVPEIALTAQLVRRFAARFPGRLAVLHSGLSLGERYDEWRRLRRGEAGLAIGSRSAVFAPLPNLGLIIVDEEHEPTYKHDGAPRYHARDVARRLAELTGSVLVLGSATPSLESYHATHTGQAALLELGERVGLVQVPGGLPRSQALPLPPVQIVDMRQELQAGNRSIFSRPLQLALSRALARGEQAILFLNRRGAATFVMCRDCGHVVSCPNCSTPLAVHYDEAEDGRPATGDTETRRHGDTGLKTEKSATLNSQLSTLNPQLLVCHSCSHREFVPLHCPACWSTRIKSFGVGTQRVVEEVELLYPATRAMRWDRDSAGRKGDHKRLLDRFLSHQADVLVGTQMIAKGLDLPLVSVVGVVAADTGLHLPDFRAGERTFQLLTQVAGRAGRRTAGAQVVLQTYNPEHYALRAAQEHDYNAFYHEEIAYRRQTGYPPFTRLVRFVYSGPNDDRCRTAAEDLAAELRRLGALLEPGDWSVIGPAPAFFHRQRNRYRWHLLLRAEHPALLLAHLALPYGWSLDIDPVHVL